MRKAAYIPAVVALLVVLQGCAPPNRFSGKYMEPTSGPTAQFLVANDSTQQVQVATYRSAERCYHKLGLPLGRNIGTSEAPGSVRIPAGRPASFTMYVRKGNAEWRTATFTIPEIVANERYALIVREAGQQVGWKVVQGHPNDPAAKTVNIRHRTGQGSPTRQGHWCR